MKVIKAKKQTKKKAKQKSKPTNSRARIDKTVASEKFRNDIVESLLFVSKKYKLPDEVTASESMILVGKNLFINCPPLFFLAIGNLLSWVGSEVHDHMDCETGGCHAAQS
jgi:hypothetical protein